MAIDFGAEMGIGYEELLNMTWLEYDYYSTGYMRRVERGFDEVRQLIAAMYNSSGFTKRKVNAKQIMKLPLLDDQTDAVFDRMSDERFKQLSKYLN
jgi:hypothetical protein